MLRLVASSLLVSVGSLFIEDLTVDSRCLNLTQACSVRVLFGVFHYFLCEFRSVVNCLLKMVRSECSTLTHCLLLTNNVTRRVVLLQNMHFTFGVGAEALRFSLFGLLLLALDFGVAVGSALGLVTVRGFRFIDGW